MHKQNILLPKLPKFDIILSSEIVLVLDAIRFDLETKGDEFAEFCWFSREFPRFYRYHLNNLVYRIQSIYQLYEVHKNEFCKHLPNSEYGKLFEQQISNPLSFRIYWEFEALLGATSSALDTLSRISGLAYSEQTPISLNKLCGKKELTGIVDLFRQAKNDWINKMKDYRDCFVHHTPVDSRVYVTIYRLHKNWKMWCKIPINPNARNINNFSFSKRVDLLRYSISIYEDLTRLDKNIAQEIHSLYKKGEFPKRTSNLFNIGGRNRTL